jgi:hypothetical protein
LWVPADLLLSRFIWREKRAESPGVECPQRGREDQKLSPDHPQDNVDKLWMDFLLAACNGNKSSIGAGCGGVLLATMKSPNKQLPNVLLEGASVIRRAFFLPPMLGSAVVTSPRRTRPTQ